MDNKNLFRLEHIRDFVTHQYFGVELSDIWSTVVTDIPLLKTQIQEIIDDIEKMPCS